MCSRDGRPKYEVAVPVTHHGRGNLVVGKRGLFVECDDSEHDARVAQIIEDPISIGEAICAPFKRVGRLMTGKIEALTADAEKTLDKTVTKGAPAAAPAKQPKPAGGSAGSLLMGGGVAVAALGSSLAYITNTFAGPNIWKLFVGIGGAVVAVMLPTVILAIVKLRRRDLSALLEGSGWAVNARMRLTRRQARFFAEKPPYPEDARGIRRWTRWVVLTVILIVIAGALAWWQGCKLRAKRQAEDTAKEKLQQNKDAGKDQSPALKATPADQAKGK